MMKSRYRICIAAGFLAASGVALAQDHECKKMGMNMMDSDAKMTKEAFMKHAEERFAHMDVNGDGVIDAGEHKKMHEHMKQCMGMKEHKGMMGDKAAPMVKPEDAHSDHHPTP
ncbi:MAG: hypothetical protein WBC62_06565 [Candidatus Macondimonas sp.]